MPGIIHKPIDRRAFINSTVAASAWAALGPKTALAAREAATSSLRIALLADTHIAADRQEEFRGFKPFENLTAIVPGVVESQPDAVIINGDAARTSGEIEDYRQLARLLESASNIAPIYIGLGNHDDRGNFLEVINEIPGEQQPMDGKHVVVLDHPTIRVVVLDSLLYVNRVAGLLGKAQRAWLEAFLDSSDERPVALVVHHPLTDGDGDLLDTDRLLDIIAPSHKVKAVFCGHRHRYAYRTHEGIHIVAQPAVGYNFADREPVGWVDSTFRTDGVDLTLRALGGNTLEDGRTTRLIWR